MVDGGWFDADGIHVQQETESYVFDESPGEESTGPHAWLFDLDWDPLNRAVSQSKFQQPMRWRLSAQMSLHR